MAKSSHHDDLLEPVLDAADDAVDWGRPWRPWSLVILSVFGGSLAAGPLAAWNFRWTGRASVTWPALLLVLVWWAGGVWAGFELYGRDRMRALDAKPAAAELAQEPGEPPAWEQKRARWRPILRVVDLAPVVAFAALQRRRFRVFEGAGGEPRSLWIPGLCAVIAALGLTLVVVPIFFAVMLGG